ncbi:efflux RND transporter periplasmic adaptor subunit [Oleiagrimonas sp. MCCC 1A03011]|uniref:efflux RND transporter periplasmic adaptor subunit n=1 Tax=Oleiagrimonas sp. MCCC 1A03011 TaxID=1926883 RepID=UPI00143DA046|nr:efflux RND transporter periplasmic adaptor subunit [Oleiagrimonas sp. MCCC 1A03011]
MLLAALFGYMVGSHKAGKGDAQPTASASAERKVLYWKAPMDPNFRSDKPGKSPMGMPLVPVYASGEGGASSDVKIDPEVVNNLGVRTALVENGTLSQRLETVGYVGYDEDTITSINTRADGWIEKLAVKSAGDTVQTGQLLYQLFSPKLATAEREYLTALSSGSTSLIDASKQRMQALGFSSAQIRQLKRTRKVSDRVARYARSTGTVMSLGISEGAYVKPATQIMKLANLHTVWVLVEVDQSHAALLHVGQKATATFDAFPGRQWHGTVDYIYPDVSTMTRTIKVRLRFANPDLRLQPNMYARVTLDTRRPGEEAQPPYGAVSIPEQALIRTGQSQRVIVALGDGRFDVCPVEAGVSSGDRVQILKGLHAGQRVVTSAQFMIDSEANVSAAALRLGAGKSGCGKMPQASGPAPSSSDMAGMDMPDKSMPSMSAHSVPAESGSTTPTHPSTTLPAATMSGMPRRNRALDSQHKPRTAPLEDSGRQPR